MATQLKQRIIGILVLLFLALIILPWLFGSNQRAVFEDKHDAKNNLANLKAGESDENFIKEPSQPTVAIAPSEAANQFKAPEDQAGIPEPGTTDNTSKAIPEEDDELIQGEDSKPHAQLESSKIAQVQNKVMHTEEEKTPHPAKTTTAKHKISEPKKPSLAKIKIPTPKETIKIAKKAPAKDWTIQLGSFSESENAQHLVKELKQKGFSAYSKVGKNAKGDDITRVLVGPNDKHSASDETLSKIEESLKIHGVIVKPSV